MVALRRACALSFAVLLVVSIFSKCSSSESRGGAYGRQQSLHVCLAALRRARFYAEAARQDAAPLIALFNACSAHAQAVAAKDLAERTGARLDEDVLAIIDEQQERIDELVVQLHGEA
jgi:hypothetical protein